SLAETTEGLHAAAAGLQFEIELRQLAAQIGVHVFEPAAGIGDGSIESLPGFQPEDHEVEGGWKRLTQAPGARTDSRAEDAVGQQEADSGSTEHGERKKREIAANVERGRSGGAG